MPTEREEYRLLPQLLEARKKLFLQSKLPKPTVNRLDGTQTELLRTVKAAEDECHRLRAVLRSIRNP